MNIYYVFYSSAIIYLLNCSYNKYKQYRFKQQLIEFYTIQNKDKLSSIDAIVKKHYNNPDNIMNILREKYQIK